ncbi:hypothetical protein ACVWWD_004313 [Mesorhizobium sp. URHB0026]|jgi:hypothetical protein
MVSAAPVTNRPSGPGEPRKHAGDIVRFAESRGGHLLALMLGMRAVGRVHVGVGRTGMDDIGGDAA